MHNFIITGKYLITTWNGTGDVNLKKTITAGKLTTKIDLEQAMQNQKRRY